MQEFISEYGMAFVLFFLLVENYRKGNKIASQEYEIGAAKTMRSQAAEVSEYTAGRCTELQDQIIELKKERGVKK